MSGALRHRSLCHLFCKLHKKEFVIGWFRSTSPDSHSACMLPLHYNDFLIYAPPSHIFVANFKCVPLPIPKNLYYALQPSRITVIVFTMPIMTGLCNWLLKTRYLYIPIQTTHYWDSNWYVPLQAQATVHLRFFAHIRRTLPICFFGASVIILYDYFCLSIWVMVWIIYRHVNTSINLTKAGGSSLLLLVLLLEPRAIVAPTAAPNCILLPVLVYDANPPLLNIL